MKKYLLTIIAMLLFASSSYGATYASFLRSEGVDGTTIDLNSQKQIYALQQALLYASGTSYYVDTVNGASDRSGKSWSLAVDTIDRAINLIGAARTAGTEKGRSIIYVREQSNEGGTATGTIFDADAAGITIWGLGTGSDMPTIDFDYTSSTCVVGADNITFYNMRFRPSTDAITKGVEVESGSDYTRFINCEFGYAETSTDEFATALYIGTSTGTKVLECLFDAGTASAVVGIGFDAATLLQIKNSKIIGAYSEACISNNITLAEEIFIEDNILWNGETDALNTLEAWELLAGTVGISRRNYIALNVANTNLAFVGDGMLNFGNYYTESSGGAKTAFAIDLVGATSSTVDADMSVTHGSGG